MIHINQISVANWSQSPTNIPRFLLNQNSAVVSLVWALQTCYNYNQDGHDHHHTPPCSVPKYTKLVFIPLYSVGGAVQKYPIVHPYLLFNKQCTCTMSWKSVGMCMYTCTCTCIMQYSMKIGMPARLSADVERGVHFPVCTYSCVLLSNCVYIRVCVYIMACCI